MRRYYKISWIFDTISCHLQASEFAKCVLCRPGPRCMGAQLTTIPRLPSRIRRGLTRRPHSPPLIFGVAEDEGRGMRTASLSLAVPCGNFCFWLWVRRSEGLSPMQLDPGRSPAREGQETRDKVPLKLKASAQMSPYFILQRCSVNCVVCRLVVLLKLWACLDLNWDSRSKFFWVRRTHLTIFSGCICTHCSQEVGAYARYLIRCFICPYLLFVPAHLHVYVHNHALWYTGHLAKSTSHSHRYSKTYTIYSI